MREAEHVHRNFETFNAPRALLGARQRQGIKRSIQLIRVRSL